MTGIMKTHLECTNNTRSTLLDQNKISYGRDTVRFRSINTDTDMVV